MPVLEPPPYQTPINSAASLNKPVLEDRGLFTMPWVQWLNSLYAYVTSISVGSSASYIQEYSLSTASTNVTSSVASPNDADILTLFFTQDTTGGRQIVYDAGPPSFNLVTVNDLDVRPNWVTVQQFVCRSDGNWWLTSVMSRLP